MKRIFLSTLLLAGIATTFSSCSNGDYNATPGTNTGVPNPIYTQVNTILTTTNATTTGGNSGSTGGNSYANIGTLASNSSYTVGTGTTSTTGFFTWTASGTAYNANMGLAIDTSVGGIRLFEVIGFTVNGTTPVNAILVAIENYAGVGTYSLNGTGGIAEYMTYNNGSAGSAAIGTSGTVNITSDGGTTGTFITGTFSFTGTDLTGNSVQITNGSFKVKRY
ncbi:MAG: hypothetical protein WCG87_11130 [Bacteroidota bacterium]